MYRAFLPLFLLGLMVVNSGCREKDAKETGIRGLNERPEVQSLVIATDEDTPVAIRLVGTDADGDLLTYAILEDPENGSLSGTPPDLSYLPAPNFSGEDRLVYMAMDGTETGESTPGEVLITVRPVNDTPTAEDVEASTDEQVPVEIQLVASDVEDIDLAYELSTWPSHGEAVFADKDPSVVIYTPNPDFDGIDGEGPDDSFTYYVRDSGDARSNTATVSINVTGQNDPPVGAADQYFIDEDEPLVRTAEVGLLANDTNIEFDGLEVTAWTEPVVMLDVDGDGVNETPDPAAESFLEFNVDTDGSFSYTPPADFYGQVAFTYNVGDGDLEADAPIDVTIYIEPVPDPPVILADPSYQVEEDAIGGLVVTADLNGDGVVDDADCPGGSDQRALLCFVDDADPGQPVKIADIEEYPTHGALSSWGEDGSFTYMPDPDFEGLDEFTVRVEDEGFLDGGTMTVNIDVIATNDAPEPVGDSYSVEEDGELVVGSEDGFLSNDTDIDIGDELRAESIPGGSFTIETDLGVVSWDELGAFVYTPAPNLNGTDSFVYYVTDGVDSVGPVEVMINVLPANDAPQPVDDGVYAAVEDVDLVVGSGCAPGEPWGLLCNDTEIDEGDLLDAFLSREPTGEDGSIAGVVVVGEDGSFTFDPYDNVNGIVTFAYEASDGEDRVEADVTIDIAPVNDAPVAVGETYEVEEQSVLSVTAGCMMEPVGLLCNDTDVDEGAVITAELMGGGTSNGVLEFDDSGTGAFTYTPDSDFNGTDTFRYRVTDGTSEGTDLSEVVDVNIVVGPVNDPPIATGDTYSTNEDEVLNVSADGSGLVRGVLWNDTDEDHATEDLTAIIEDGIDPDYGAVVLAGDGSFTFTPMPNQNNDTQGGDATFTYYVEDLEGARSETVTARITVNPVNDPPTAGVDGPFTVDEDDTLVFSSVLDNDSDIDGDALEAVLLEDGSPEHGDLLLGPDGSFSYQPDPDYYGADSFTYVARDPGRDGSGPLDSEPIEVLIDVIQVLDVPVAVEDADYEVDEDVTLVVDGSVWPSLLANDSDADPDDTLSAVVSQAPGHGSLDLESNGLFSYVPHANFNGTDTFTYWAFDGSLYSGNGTPNPSLATTVTITVHPVNDAPNANDDAYVATEDELLTVESELGLLANDDDLIDEEGATLRVIDVEDPSSGTITDWDAFGGFAFSPDDDFNGTVTFTYTVADLDGLGAGADPTSNDTATVTLTVEPVNDNPVGVVDLYTTEEETTLNVSTPDGLLANDLDVDGDDLQAFVVDEPMFGTVTANTTGAFAYTPGVDFVGDDSFTYEAVDSAGASSGPVLVTVTVVDRNDAPVAVDDAYTTPEDTELEVGADEGLIANDFDVDGDSMDASIVIPPEHGDLALSSDGSFTYTPDPDYFGTDSFEYMVEDDSGAVGTGWVILEVTAVNDAPVASPESYTTSEDTTLTTTVVNGLLANDTDVDGDDLDLVVVSETSDGVLDLDLGNGTFTYTPDPHFFGSDTFTYQAFDGEFYSEEIEVDLTVVPVDDAPIADADAYDTDEDETLVVVAGGGVLANDTEIDGDAMTAVLRSSPAHGELTSFGADGSFVYVPDSDFNGTDSFTYEATALGVPSEPGTVTITIDPVNDAAVPTNDFYSTEEDVDLVVDAPGLLANDVDIDTDASALTVDAFTYGGTGTVTLDADGLGGFTYEPAADFNGVEEFTYTVFDGELTSAEATVRLTVGADNDRPDTVADSYELDEDTSLAVSASEGVLANDSDTDGDSLTVALVDAPDPTTGSVSSLGASGGFLFIPAENYHGEATFTYQAFDGVDLSVVTTVTLTILPVNDAPIAQADTYSTPEDTELSVAVAAGLLANDSDVESDPFTLTVVQDGFMDPAEGTVTLSPDGSFTFTPAAEFTGVATFAYRIVDGDEISDSETVSIVVVGGNDLPEPGDDAYELEEDGTLNILEAAGVLANDIDVDGDTLSATIDAGSGPSNGEVVLEPNGAFTYVPDPDFNGTDSFTYTVDDGLLAVSGTLVTLTVNPVNDAPVAGDDLFSMEEDSSVSFDLFANDVDVDGDDFELVLDGSEASVGGELFWETDLDGALTGSFTYTPEDDFAGDVSFTYTITDGSLVSDLATVTIEVTNTNDSPIVIDETGADAYTVTEDEPLAVAAGAGLLANDSDSDGDALTAEIREEPEHGSVEINTNGSFTYTPDEDYDGTVDGEVVGDSFSYWVQDGITEAVAGHVDLTFIPVNDSPEANWVEGTADTVTTEEDTPSACGVAGGCLFSNDRDIDSPDEDLTTTLVSDAVHGVATVGASGLGTYTYTPDDNYTGDDSFSYQLCDPEFCTDPVVVAVTVTETNDHPVGVPDLYTATEDELLIVDPLDGVLANDSDVDGHIPLTAVVIGTVSSGELVFFDDGSFEFMPEADFEGTATFQYRVFDSEGLGPEADAPTSVTLNVVGVNDPPVTVADAYEVSEDEVLDVSRYDGFLDNDVDVEDGVLSVIAIDVEPTMGVLTWEVDGAFIYTPFADEDGDRNEETVDDSFTYRMSDGTYEATGVVSITILPINDPPVADNDTYTFDEDTVLDVDVANGVLSNDADVEGDPMSAVLVETTGSGPEHGTLDLHSDGSFSYTPDPDYFGADSFEYEVWDSFEQGTTGTVTLNVENVQDAPTAESAEIALDEDTFAECVEAPCFVTHDVDGDELTFSVINTPQHGTLDLSADGTYTYTPVPDYYGEDSFMYQVDDGNGGLADASVLVTVDPVQDAPLATSVAISVPDGARYDVGSNWTCTAEATAYDDEPTLTFDFTWTLLSGAGTHSQSASVVTTEGAEISGSVHESLATASVTMNPVTEFASMKKGDTVECSVEARDTVGNTSDPITSDDQVVENALPLMLDAVVTSEPDSANVDSTLTCTASASDLDVDDTLLYTYTWTLLDSGVLASETSNSETSTLVLADHTASGVARDETVRCDVTVSDGEDEDGPEGDEVTLGNAPPTVSVVSFDDVDGGRATVESTLRCAVSGADSDADDLTYSYAITSASGADAPAATEYVSDTHMDFDIAPYGYEAGETLTCTVTPKDSEGVSGEPAALDLVLENALPVVTGAVTVVDPTGDDPNAGSILACSATVYDADGDDVTLSYAWTWTSADGGSPVNFGADATSVSLISEFDITKGDTVSCTVTPTDDEGLAADTVSATGSVVLVNDVPQIETAVSVTPADPYVTDEVACSGMVLDADLAHYGGEDTVTVQITWQVNGTDDPSPEDIVVDPDGTFSTSVVLNTLTGPSGGQPAVGDQVTCSVLPADSDGAVGELVLSNDVVVNNSLPVVSGVTLAPEIGGDTYINSAMVCTVTGVVDADTADSARYDFHWYVGGVEVHADLSSGYGDTTGSYDLSLAGLDTTDFGSEVSCTATPVDDHDGYGDPVASASVVLQNQPPVVDMTLVYADTGDLGFDSGDAVTCSGTIEDLDGNGTQYTVNWYVSESIAYGVLDLVVAGTPVVFTDSDSFTSSYPEASALIDLSAVTGDDPYIFCEVVAEDAADSTTESDVLQVGNAPPVVASVVITGDPDPITKASSLTCTATVSDVDVDDTVNLTFEWWVGGVSTGITESFSGVATGGASGSETSSAVLVSDVESTGATELGAESGDTVTCQVTAEATGAETVDEASIVIGNHVPVVAEVDFSGGPPEALVDFDLHTEQVTCSGVVDEFDGDAVAVRTYLLMEEEPDLAIFLDTVAIDPATGAFTVTQYTGGDACDSSGGTPPSEDCLNHPDREVILPGGYVSLDEVLIEKFDSDTGAGNHLGCSAEPVEASPADADAEYEGTSGPFVHGEVAISDYDAIVNATPILSATISPEDPNNNSDMTCSVEVFDADGDGGNLMVEVLLDGVVMETVDYVYASEAPGVATQQMETHTFTLDPVLVGTGDTVTCDWTMDDNDGGVATVTAETDVGNSMPSVLDVAISPATGPLVEQETTCTVAVSDVDAGDSLTVDITWFAEGGLAATSGSLVVGEDGEVSSVVIPGVLGMVKGDELYCMADVTDGGAVDTMVSDVVTVQDTTPALLDVSLTPEDPTVTDTVTCSVSAYEADMDTTCARFELQWSHDATTEVLTMTPSEMGPTVMGTSSVFNLSTEDMGRGDTLTCRADVVQSACGDLAASETAPGAAVATLASATDLSNTVTVANSAPVVSASWSDETPNRNDVITCSASVFDADSDTTFDYSIAISDHASTYETVGEWTSGDPDPFATHALADVPRGTDVDCVVTVQDDFGGEGTDTATATVQDTPPVMTSVTLTPDSPSRLDTVSCVADVSDIDGDDLCVRFQLEGSGTESTLLPGSDGTATWTVSLSDYPVSVFAKFDALTCDADVVSVDCATATGSSLGEDIGALASGVGSDATVIVNAPPFAGDDNFDHEEGTIVALDVLANDEDVDEDPLSLVLVGSPSIGSVVDDGDAFLYIADPDATGTDSFTYRVNDGSLDSAIATVTVEVSPVNDVPVFGEDVYDWVYGATGSFDGSFGLLGNDFDVDSTLTVIAGDLVSDEGRLVEVFADGSFDYYSENVLADDADGDGVVEDTFEYTVVEDGGGAEGVTHVRTATLRLNGPFIWFVDNTESGSDGHESDPFGTLLEAETASSDGEIIYVKRGDGTDLGQDASIAMKPGQWLAGCGADLTVEGIRVKAESGLCVASTTSFGSPSEGRPVISARASGVTEPVVILPADQDYTEIKVTGVALEYGWAGISQIGDWAVTDVEAGTAELVGSLVVDHVAISEVMFGINAGGPGKVSVTNSTLNGERQHANISEVYAPNNITFWGVTNLWADANCDGETDYVEDDFVEITNTMHSDMDLEGHQILVDGSTWHTFEAGDVLGAGEAAVVFGGGVPAEIEAGYELEVVTEDGIPDPGRAYWASSDADWPSYEFTNWAQAGSFIEFDMIGTGIHQLSHVAVELEIHSYGDDYGSGRASDDCPDTGIDVDVFIFSEEEGSSIDATTGRWINGVDIGSVRFNTPTAGGDSIYYDGTSEPLVSGSFNVISVEDLPLYSASGDWTIRYQLQDSCGADDYAHFIEGRYGNGGVVLTGSENETASGNPDASLNHCFEEASFGRYVASVGGDLGSNNTTVSLVRPDGSTMNSLLAYPDDYVIYEDDDGNLSYSEDDGDSDTSTHILISDSGGPMCGHYATYQGSWVRDRGENPEGHVNYDDAGSCSYRWNYGDNNYINPGQDERRGNFSHATGNGVAVGTVPTTSSCGRALNLYDTHIENFGGSGALIMDQGACDADDFDVCEVTGNDIALTSFNNEGSTSPYPYAVNYYGAQNDLSVYKVNVDGYTAEWAIAMLIWATYEGYEQEVPHRIELEGLFFGDEAANDTYYDLFVYNDATMMDLTMNMVTSPNNVLIQNSEWSSPGDGLMRTSIVRSDFAEGWSLFNDAALKMEGSGSDFADHLVSLGSGSDGGAPVIIDEDLGVFDSLAEGTIAADWPAETCDAYYVGTDELAYTISEVYLGNVYEVEQDVTLQAMSQHLVLVDPCDLRFYVHTAPSSSGPWDLAAEVTVPAAPDGDQFYDSGALDVSVEAGEFLSTGVVAMCSATHYYSVNSSFAPTDELTGGDVGGYMTNIGYALETVGAGTPSGALVSTLVNFEQMVFLTPDE